MLARAVIFKVLSNNAKIIPNTFRISYFFILKVKLESVCTALINTLF